MALQLLLSWWNLIYLVPLALALIYLIVYMVSGLSFGDADVDADHDVSVEHDVSAEHDAEGNHDTEHDAEQQGGSFSVLSLLGVGKAPISILLMVFVIIWSLVGMAMNRVIWGASESVLTMLVVSVPVAFVAAVLGTGGVARLFGRYLPNSETYVRGKKSLVGLMGEAEYDMSDGFGVVQVRDEGGDLHQLACRMREGEKRAIKKGERVVVFEYDAEKEVFFVAPVEIVEDKKMGINEPETRRIETRRREAERE